MPRALWSTGLYSIICYLFAKKKEYYSSVRWATHDCLFDVKPDSFLLFVGSCLKISKANLPPDGRPYPISAPNKKTNFIILLLSIVSSSNKKRTAGITPQRIPTPLLYASSTHAFLVYTTLVSALPAVSSVFRYINTFSVAIRISNSRFAFSIFANLSLTAFVAALCAICGIVHQTRRDTPALCCNALTAYAFNARRTSKSALTAVRGVFGYINAFPVAIRVSDSRFAFSTLANLAKTTFVATLPAVC